MHHKKGDVFVFSRLYCLNSSEWLIKEIVLEYERYMCSFVINTMLFSFKITHIILSFLLITFIRSILHIF